MEEKATPAILDKKRGKNTEDVPMIVYRRNGVDSEGNAVVIEHGPMPVSEWAAFEKENNL